MNSQLSLAVAQTRQQDMLRTAAGARRAAGCRPGRIARLRRMGLIRRQPATVVAARLANS